MPTGDQIIRMFDISSQDQDLLGLEIWLRELMYAPYIHVKRVAQTKPLDEAPENA